MRRRAGAVVATALATIAGGCGQGGPPADLFVVERTGDVPGGRLTLRLTDDGGAHCNGGGRVDLTSDQLLTAREIRRALDGEPDEQEAGLAERRLRLPPGRLSIFGYQVRSEEGTVHFADTSPGLPAELAKLLKLTRDVAREQCGLVR